MKEQELKRYVIATLNVPTLYLKSLHMGNYCFVDNLVEATKTVNKNVAEQMKNYFYQDTGLNIDLVVVPLKIKYELINELDD